MKTTGLRLLIVIVFFLPIVTRSQPTTYHKVIPTEFTTMEVLKMPDHGYLHAGNTMSGKGCIIRTDSACNIISMKKYDIAAPLIYPQVTINHLMELPDGNYLSVGSVSNTITSGLDALVMKTDAAGNIIWSNKINQTGYSISLYSATLMPDSGYVFCGTASTPPPSSGTYYFAARMDSSGALLWSNTYSGGNSACYGRIIRTTSDSGCIFTGYFEDFPPFLSYAALIKLNASGNVDWARKISSPTPGVFISGSDVQVLPDGYLVYGVSNSVFVTRTDLSGIPLWSKEYPNFSQNTAFINYKGNRICTSATGGYLFITGDDFFGTANRIDSSGSSLWSSLFYMRLYNVLETDNGEWHFTGGGPIMGVTQPQPDAGAPDSEVGIIQSDAQGMPDIACMFSQSVTQTNVVYTSSLYIPIVNAVGALSQVTIIVTGDTSYTIDTCVNVFGGFEEFGLSLPLVVSPNPGAGSFMISLPDNHSYQLIVVNIFGQRIRSTQVQGRDVPLHLEEEADGVYLCRILSADGKKCYQGRIIKSGR